MRMKNWKRITASALSICMLATYAPCLAEEGGILQAPVTVHAETSDVIVTGTCGKNATWNYNKTTKVMTITGTEITMMPFSFKRYKKEIKKLVFSGGITKITRNFFEDFTALEDIEFGGVKKIEDSAFKGCTALTSLNLNGNLKKIGNSAFAGCTSLTSLNLDGNLEEIGEEAFLNCKNLTTVTVGSKVKTVYYDIFKGCDNLTSITVSKDNAYLYAEGKKLLNANISGTCGKNITFSYNPKTKTLTFSGSGAMKNGNYGFDEDCNWDVYVTWFTDTPYRNVIMHEMQTLVIGDNITSIGKCAFVNCDALKTVKLGKNVSTIGDYAFTGCKALETIQSGSKITSIGKRAFSKCSKLNKMSAFPNITKIGNYSFYGCKKLKTFSIGKSVKSIGEGAFSECTNLRKFSIHKKNKYFSKRDNMLLNKQQTKIISACLGSNKTCNIYSSVKNIDKTILEDSSVKSFSVNKNNPNYSSKGGLLYSKNGKTLKKCPARMSGIVNIDDTVTSMDIGAFQICNNITQINIGKNVKSINLDPRSISANKLNKIEISKKNKYYYEANGSVISKADDELIYCYKIDGDTYTIPNSVKEIGTYAFSTQNNLKNVILSDNITELDDYEVFHIDADYILKIESIHLGKNFNDPTKKFEAFFEITTLKEITVSNENPNYTSIDGVLYDKDVTELAFFPNAKKSYTIPDSVTSTGNYSNYSHSLHNLKNLTISDTITDATDLFNLCYYVETIHIGKKVNKLNGNSTNTFPNIFTLNFFPNVKYLSVDEENSNYKVVNNMLYSKDGSKLIWCPSETEGKVVLEEGVTEISECAFGNCTKITDIVIPATISKVEEDAFGQKSLNYLVSHGYGQYVAHGYTDNYPVDSIIIWVPKGTKDYYKSLFTEDTGFVSNMVIMELEN